MSDPIAGTHLSREDLEQPEETKLELKYLSDILQNEPFDNVSATMQKCVSEGTVVKQQVKRVLMLAMGYGDLEFSQIEYEIFHLVAKTYISFGRAAYLVPIGTGPDALRISDPSTAPAVVSVGQRVFFDRPIIIQPGRVLIIRAKRKQQVEQKGGQDGGQIDGRKDGQNDGQDGADNNTDSADAG